MGGHELCARRSIPGSDERQDPSPAQTIASTKKGQMQHHVARRKVHLPVIEEARILTRRPGQDD
jgi:hypothetical protein